jgi:hypothetical protein
MNCDLACARRDVLAGRVVLVAMWAVHYSPPDTRTCGRQSKTGRKPRLAKGGAPVVPPLPTWLGHSSAASSVSDRAASRGGR